MTFAVRPIFASTVKDPYFANVALLMHMDGGNGSTAFVDNSPTPKILTSFNAAQSSTQVKFGPSSAFFSTAAFQCVTIPSHTDFEVGNGNYTVEAWMFRTGVNSTAGRVWTRYNDQYSGMDLSIDTNGKLAHYLSSTGTSWNLVSGAASAIIPLNQWVHVASVRNGGTLTAYVNGSGTVISSGLGTATLSGMGNRSVGGQPGVATNRTFPGYLDEFRITKGVARYTADFTPPTRPFPNS